MSTYLYLECWSHNPHLRADEESGQHLRDLDRIRADVADCRALVFAARKMGERPDYRVGGHRSNTLRFLLDHENCDIHLVDEYGDEHPLHEAAPGTAI